MKDRNMGQLIKLSNKSQSGSFQGSGKGEEKQNGSVLISKASQLVDVLIVDQSTIAKFFVTIDSENLVRYWDPCSNTTSFTFKIPLKNRVTAVDIDKNERFLAAGDCTGDGLVCNSKSGSIVYKLPR